MSEAKAKWLADHYQKVAQGGISQQSKGDDWYDHPYGPDLGSKQARWRVVMPEYDTVSVIEQAQALIDDGATITAEDIMGWLYAQQAEIERLKAQAAYHIESQKEDYNKLEDALVINEKLYEFVHSISTDYFELSHEKVRIQRDDYMRMARELIEGMHNDH